MSAYRKQYSCETTLVRLIEDWKKAKDDGCTTAILSTDMTKAFDSLHPTLLLAKLKAYGLSQCALDLMSSYFSDRVNRTRMGTITSNWVETKRGCPQGSSLGPLLWNIYQNDLAYVEMRSNLPMYADDHQIYCFDKDPEQALRELKKDGKNASKWYKENFLEGNLNKYNIMVITKQPKQQLDVEIDGFRIKQAEDLKLLGVIIDDDLTFSKHISATGKKASMRVGVLMRLRKLIPVEAKLQIYKTAILPYLTYCGLSWHFCRKSDSNKLERINERGLRAVYCDWNSPYSELLIRAKLTTLYNRRLQDIAIFMYKVKNNQVPQNVLELFPHSPANYNLRNNDFFIPRVRTTTYGKHSLRFFGPYLWAKLQSSIRNSNSLSSFKIAIRKMDLSALITDVCKDCNLCHC